MPDALPEVVRRVRKREHGDPGSEWPHWSGIADPETIARLREVLPEERVG